jgi:tetratricopeptide (TPR) repeat protein/GGDEF domain-containing protein
MLADDYAALLASEELARFVGARAAERPVVLFSAIPDGLSELQELAGPARLDVVLRELALLVRRNLRGSDALSLEGGELVVMVDASPADAGAVSARLLAAVRAHHFTGGGADAPLRLTLSLGAATSPADGLTFDALSAAARASRAAATEDTSLIRLTRPTSALDLDRFVGRAEPLAHLINFLDDLVRGMGRVVAIIGEAGVGTTALARNIGFEVRLRGGSLVRASCRDHVLPNPYAVWSEVLRSVRRLPVKSTRMWRELPSLDPTMERLADEPGHGGSKVRLLEELADFLRLAAQQRPLFVLLEEMQWADAASWDALEYLIPQLESERIVLALTMRARESSDDGLERWARLRSRPRHEELRLTRLTRDDVKRLVEGAMGHDQVGHDLLAYLYRHSEGNPLRLGHVLRDLEESGHLTRTNEQWRWSPLQELPPPVSFDALVGRRVGRLPVQCREVLDLAAVIGREFDEVLIRRAIRLEPGEVSEALACGSSARLLLPTYDRATSTYQFAHEELARAMREQIPARLRAELQARVATVLAERGGVSDSEIAWRFEFAGLHSESHRHAVRAADAALAVYDNSSAATLLTAAARTAPSSDELAAVRVRLATIAEVAGRYEEAETLCDLALAWYEAENDCLEAIRLKRMRELLRMQRGQTARATLDALLALGSEAVEAGADAERAAILLVSSQMLARLGEPRSAQRVAEECVEIAGRCADPFLLADSYNRLGLSLILDDPTRARTLFERALEIITPLGESFRQVRCLNNIGIVDLAQLRWTQARANLTAAVELARAAGLTEHWARASLNLGVLALRTGDHPTAAIWLAEALRGGAEAQHTELQLIATYNSAHLEREEMRHATAGDLYELAMELAKRIGQAEIQTGALAGVGLSRLACGDEAEALRLHELLQPMIAAREDWFQNRELVEALGIQLALQGRAGRSAGDLFADALALAAPSDVYGAAWLIAEFGQRLSAEAPELISTSVRSYAGRPEVIGNPRIRDRFDELSGRRIVSIDQS